MTAETAVGPTAAFDRHADEEIAREVRAHHAAMAVELDRLTARLQDADPEAQPQARDRLTEWFKTVLVPHADEEERTTYRAAGELPQGALLIEAMVREHGLIKRLITLFEGSDGAAAAAYGRAVYEAFESHQRKENEVILPLLIDAPQVSLAAALGADLRHQTGHDRGHYH
jgi:hypothetical protein